MTASSQRINVPDTSHKEIDLSQLLGTLWRGKFWIIFFGFVALVAGGYYAFQVATPLYTATATVVQDNDPEPVVSFSAGLGSGLGGDQNAINTEIEVLRSRALVEKLVQEMNLVADPEFNPALQPAPLISVGKIIGLIRNAIAPSDTPAVPMSEEQVRDAVVTNVQAVLAIANIRQSYVYSITATTNSAQKSAQLVNVLANLYIVDQLETKSEKNLQATRWLTDRLGELQIELEGAEEAVKDFNAKTDLINADTLAALSRQVKELRERLETVREDLVTLEVRITLMTAARDSGDAQQMVDVANDRALTRLFNGLTNAQNTNRTAFDAYFDQLIRQDRLERDRVRAQIASLSASIREQEQATDQQSTDLITLQQLEREAEASRLLYEFFLTRLKETTVQSGIQTPDSRVLSRAIVPLLPTAPRKVVIMAVSLMLGMFTGSALVLIREMLQNTFRAADELEQRTGYEVLGQIPKIPARRRAKLLQYLTDKPTSVAAEAVRNMRTSVLLSNVDQPPQIIMSTSSIPGEGKTTQSLSLTQNLAGLGKKVLLIEGDVRKRIFAEYFQIKDENGLMSVLEARMALKDAVSHEKSLKADVLMSEKPSANAADIFSSHGFTELLKQARKDYDYIVIDTPPVLAVPDARIIGRQVDTTLYTVRWDSTTQRQVIQGLKELAQVSVPIAGLVLSQINHKRLKRYGYGDQSSAYTGYHNN